MQIAWLKGDGIGPEIIVACLVANPGQNPDILQV